MNIHIPHCGVIVLLCSKHLHPEAFYSSFFDKASGSINGAWYPIDHIQVWFTGMTRSVRIIFNLQTKVVYFFFKSCHQSICSLLISTHKYFYHWLSAAYGPTNVATGRDLVNSEPAKKSHGLVTIRVGKNNPNPFTI